MHPDETRQEASKSETPKLTAREQLNVAIAQYGETAFNLKTFQDRLAVLEARIVELNTIVQAGG